MRENPHRRKRLIGSSSAIWIGIQQHATRAIRHLRAIDQGSADLPTRARESAQAAFSNLQIDSARNQAPLTPARPGKNPLAKGHWQAVWMAHA